MSDTILQSRTYEPHEHRLETEDEEKQNGMYHKGDW